MLVGVGLTIVLQASSATLTLVLTAVAGGMMPVEVGAAVVIGADVGTTLTGILAAIGATSNARRLAAAHVLFNVVTAVVAMALLSPLLRLIHALGVWLTGSGDVVTQLVIFHTLFNLHVDVALVGAAGAVFTVPFWLGRRGCGPAALSGPATWPPSPAWRCRPCAVNWHAWGTWPWQAKPCARTRWPCRGLRPNPRPMRAWHASCRRWSTCKGDWPVCQRGQP